MTKDVIYNSERLRKDLKYKRVVCLEISMDVCSKEIGISKPTLARLEQGNMPDLITFFKVVKWLGTDMKKYFNF